MRSIFTGSVEVHENKSMTGMSDSMWVTGLSYPSHPTEYRQEVISHDTTLLERRIREITAIKRAEEAAARKKASKRQARARGGYHGKHKKRKAAPQPT